MERSDKNKRLSQYKANKMDPMDSRMRRHENAAALRKMRKEHRLLKSRDIKVEDMASSLYRSDGEPKEPMTLDDVVAAMNSSEPERQFVGMRKTRQILCHDKNPPIDMIIDRGLVPICVRFLQDSSNTPLQLEAAWALTNIAAGTSEQTQCVIDHGAVPFFVSLLESKSLKVAEQAVWALANIAGDGVVGCDVIVKHNGIDALLRLIDNGPRSFMPTIAWLMVNLCRNRESLSQVKRLLPVLAQLLISEDVQILTDVCWAFSYVTNNGYEGIRAVVESGAVPRLVNMMQSTESSFFLPALRSVGNIVTGTEEQTELVIAAGGLTKLSQLLEHSNGNIVDEALWILSNIAVDSELQVQAVMDSGIFHKLGDLLESGVFRTQMEAAWAVTNVITAGSITQVIDLLKKYDILKPYIKLLDSEDVSTLKVIMVGLKHLLLLAEKVDDGHNLCLMIEEFGGVDKLEALQNHENYEIYCAAVDIVETYFSDLEYDQLATVGGY